MLDTERLNYSLHMLKGRFARIQKNFIEGKLVKVKEYSDIYTNVSDLLFSVDTLMPIAIQQCAEYPTVTNRNRLEFFKTHKYDVLGLFKDVKELGNQINKKH
ncbi:hypothetical protein ABEY65_27600 [Priestia aryabhattai]|uniref:hypothetical protein n=1 Tax=Priestia aryabhattai TaxID=412384 RepID=UPI003D271EA3